MAPVPQPEFMEVRCAGCGETLEVERGLTEFACPDCGTQQALPPELMPPPPRPRRALPIPGRGPAVPVPVPVPAPARMPCGGCGALLSVPAGLGRFACPLCSVELVVDGGRLRFHLASLDTTTVSIVALPPAGVTLTSPYTRQPEENAHGGHLPLGSDGKSSGKRKGRRPTRLIEPRREVDRPILIPNNIDNWDVSPPCTKVASTITVLMKQKYPGSTYLPVGQHGDVPPNGEVVYHWHEYPPETRAAILNEFLQRYKWAPGQEAECLKLFERRAVRQFAGLLCEEKWRVRAELASVQKPKESTANRHTGLDEENAREEPEDQKTAEKSEDENPLLWKPFPPAWMYPKWWQRLCEHWAKEDVLMMSLQNRKNRFTGGHAHHTTGSRSIAMHRQLMVIENGGELVSELEVFNKTHKLKGGIGDFVSERAKRTVEGFKKRMEEAGDKQIDPHLAWAQEVGGRNRGRYYGLTGIIDKAKIDELAKSIPGCFGRPGQRHKFTQEQVQQMINQALQGLNETWENKFKSLEQSVRGAPLLGVDPERAPGSSAAGGGVQENRSTNQDGSDHQHGERHRSDDDDEEVVSTSA